MQLTSEQQAIVEHPMGSHARVLAVAGSGKTTTLVHRLQHLLLTEKVPPASILVLMFNRLARRQFQEKLEKIGLPPHLRPNVYTFHAFAYHFVNSMVKEGRIPRHIDLWVGSRSELYRIYVRRAIENLERRRLILPYTVGATEVMRAISLWKGALIPPERAGYHGKQGVPLAYAEFEKLRTQKQALTFDDFVPTALRIIRKHGAVRERWCGRIDHLIVDEYQDVNHGQQQLIELIAGDRADVMVVGDDDQTIYEWRGARPSYIIEEFDTAFADKDRKDYRLTRSFRFGPLLAQAAFNTIRHNQYRVRKDVVAHAVTRQSKVLLYDSAFNGGMDTTKEMVDQILLLVTEQSVPPHQIAVLVRLFVQLVRIEIECLQREVPYRVIGQEPFFDRQENMVLRHYVQVALALDEVVTAELMSQLLDVANKPTRYLPRRQLESALDGARLYGLTLQEALSRLAQSAESSLNPSQRAEALQLLQLLQRIRERMDDDSELKAGRFLHWLVDTIDYLSHFDDYYGPGETSFERKAAVLEFIRYAHVTGLTVTAFLHHLDRLDTAHGAPPWQQIVMTSIHRTKGLEWDHVFLPQVTEEFMPYLHSEDERIYDTGGEIGVARHSPPLESERRLFYVALTRARNTAHIEAPRPDPDGGRLPSRFLEEIQLEETSEILNALQEVAMPAKRAKHNENGSLLLDSVKRHGGHRHITRLLADYYLRQIDRPDLATRVEQLAAEQEPVSFVYRNAYRKGGGKQVDSAGNQGQSLSQPWQKLAQRMKENRGQETNGRGNDLHELDAD